VRPLQLLASHEIEVERADSEREETEDDTRSKQAA
jgi:hypothetical protein